MENVKRNLVQRNLRLENVDVLMELKRTENVKKKSGPKKSSNGIKKKSSSRKRRSSRRVYMTSRKCKEALQDKIRLIKRERKYGNKQSVAIAYSMVGKKYPNCKKIFERSRKKKS